MSSLETNLRRLIYRTVKKYDNAVTKGEKFRALEAFAINYFNRVIEHRKQNSLENQLRLKFPLVVPLFPYQSNEYGMRLRSLAMHFPMDKKLRCADAKYKVF